MGGGSSMSSKQFQVGDVVRHRRRGVGQVSSADAESIRVKYASGQSSPPMQPEDAAQLLTKLPEDSPEALLLEHPESLQPWIEDAPLKLVATAVSVNGNSANASSIEHRLAPVFNPGEWKAWWEEVRPFAKKSPYFKFTQKGATYSLREGPSEVPEERLLKPVKVKDWADWLKSPDGKAPVRPQLSAGLLRNTISVVQGETWPPDFPLTLASELASDLKQSAGNDSRNFLKALYQPLGRPVRVALSQELANSVLRGESVSTPDDDALDLLLAAPNPSERKQVLQNLAVQAAEGYLPSDLVGNYLAGAVADVQDAVLGKTTRQLQDALNAPDAGQWLVELLFEIQTRLAELKRQSTSRENQLKRQALNHQKELERLNSAHDKESQRQNSLHQEALRQLEATLKEEQAKHRAEVDRLNQQNETLRQHEASLSGRLKDEQTNRQKDVDKLNQQARDLHAQLARGRDEFVMEARYDILKQLALAFQNLHRADASVSELVQDAKSNLLLALGAGGAQEFGAVGELTEFNPQIHHGADGLAAGDKVRITLPGIKVLSSSDEVAVLRPAETVSIQEGE